MNCGTESVLSTSIGAFRWLILPLAIILMLLLWSRMRTKVLTPLELGLVIIVALLIGPITWDHYIAWAIIAIVYGAEYALWIKWPTRQRLELFIILVMSIVILSV